VYAQSLYGKTQYGIVCAASVDEYERGVIKRHELTRKKKEDDRTKLTDYENANEGPVFLTYDCQPEIDALVNEVIKDTPYFDFIADDSIGHKFWKMTAEQSSRTTKLFEKINCLYIADGHHRAAASFNVGKMRREKMIKEGGSFTGNEDFMYFLSIIYPSNQLTIFDYNRVIKDTCGKTKEQIFEEAINNIITKF
jgi:uncharacterized protein (DUF1015 family)